MRKKNPDTLKLKGITVKANPKSPNGKMIATITADNGQIYNRGLGTSDLTTAIARAIEIQKELNLRLNGAGDDEKVCEFGEMVKEYIASLEREGKIKRDIQPYITTYNRMIGQRIHNKTGEVLSVGTKERELIPLLSADSMCHSITIEQWDQWFKWMKTQLGHSTLRGHITRIAFIFEYAALKGYAVPNISWRDKYKEVNDDEHKSRDFKETEVAELLDYLKASKAPHNYYRFQTLLHTGIRLGEMCTLLRANVDIDLMTIKVRRTKKKKSVLETIPINNALAEELKIWLDMTKDIDSEWLFCHPDGSMLGKQSLWLTKACKKLGINGLDGQKIVAHSTRSRYITRQIQAGVPLPSVQKSVGHLWYDTTLRYERLCPTKATQDAADVMQRLDDDRKVTQAELKAKMAALDAERAALKAKMDAVIAGLDNI